MNASSNWFFQWMLIIDISRYSRNSYFRLKNYCVKSFNKYGFLPSELFTFRKKIEIESIFINLWLICYIIYFITCNHAFYLKWVVKEANRKTSNPLHRLLIVIVLVYHRNLVNWMTLIGKIQIQSDAYCFEVFYCVSHFCLFRRNTKNVSLSILLSFQIRFATVNEITKKNELDEETNKM